MIHGTSGLIDSFIILEPANITSEMLMGELRSFVRSILKKETGKEKSSPAL
jgi:hypothetical protein